MSIKNNTLTMTTDPRTEAERQREHFLDRLSDAYDTRRMTVRPSFYLDDMDPPSGPKELAERLAKGLYLVPKPQEEKFDRYESWYSTLQWRDPAKPADHDGWKKFSTAIQKQKNDTADQMIVAEPKDLPKILKDFETATI